MTESDETIGKVKPSAAIMGMIIFGALGILVGSVITTGDVPTSDAVWAFIMVIVFGSLLTGIIVGAYLAGRDDEKGQK